jgi:tartrate dehydratase alpha subunit/fumarate hydratase class I-like protein
MWRQFHGFPASGGGIEGVFFSTGKQHDDLKKKTMDKTLENTLKSSINTKLPTCDDKGVFTMMMTPTGNTSSLRW